MDIEPEKEMVTILSKQEITEEIVASMESVHQPFVVWDEKFSMPDLLEKIHDVWQNASHIENDLNQIKPLLEEQVKETFELTLSFLPEK